MYEKSYICFCLRRPFLPKASNKKRRRCSKIRIGLREHFLQLPGDPTARKRPGIENVLGESKKAAKDTNLKNKT